MRLEQLDELNRYSREIKENIHFLQLQYLVHDSEYPYDKINDLINRYKNLYDKVYRKKIKAFFGNKSQSEEFKNRYVNEILCGASELSIPYIINSFGYDDNLEKRNLSLKLFPIIINLRLEEIISLYRIFKIKISSDEIFNNSSLMYLQEMFVDYIKVKTSQGSLESDSENCFRWSDNDICEVMLKEVMLLKRVDKKRYIDKKYP